MNRSIFEKIQESAKILNIDLYAAELAGYTMEQEFSREMLEAIEKVFSHLRKKKEESIVTTLLRMSRLPLKEPKTFEGFDFNHVHGKNIDALRNLPTLSALYAHRNLAFIGPQGVGKTHLAMAYGRECCKRGMKTYFLKATELNQRMSDARRFGREGNMILSLVKPTCLIIDEVGRYNKDGPNTMIFTSNKSPDKWDEFFSEDSSLLCALDRIFDDAMVFMMKGASYRGRKLETIAIETGSRRATKEQ